MRPHRFMASRRIRLLRSSPPRFRTGLLAATLFIPGYVAIVAIVLLIGPWKFGLAVLGLALVLALLRSTSRITIRDGQLRTRFFGYSQSLRLDQLTEIRTDVSRASLGWAPALRMGDALGNRLSLRLGWWRAEHELLGIVAEAVARSGAHIDEDAANILRSRPSGETWDAMYPGERPDWVRRLRG